MRGLFLLLVALMPAQAFATGITYTHPGTGARSGFTFTPTSGGTYAQLQVTHVCNSQTFHQTVYLHAWHSTSSNPAGSTGYDTAVYNIGNLAPGTCLSVNTNTPYTRPPAGTYYVHILANTSASPNTYDDALTSSGTVTITGPGGGSPGGVFSFGGNIAYLIEDGTTQMWAGSICNGRSTTSGTLYWKLRYTTGAAPTSLGYDVSTVTLSPLAAGTCYTNLERTAAASNPPDGVYYAHFVLTEHPATTTIIASATFADFATVSTSQLEESGGSPGPLALLGLLGAALARRVRGRSAPAP